MFSQRTVSWPIFSRRRLNGSLPSSLNGAVLSSEAIASWPGRERMYVGVRCNIVTFSARSLPEPARLGSRVTAVAPEPMMTTFLPA